MATWKNWKQFCIALPSTWRIWIDFVKSVTINGVCNYAKLLFCFLWMIDQSSRLSCGLFQFITDTILVADKNYFPVNWQTCWVKVELFGLFMMIVIVLLVVFLSLMNCWFECFNLSVCFTFRPIFSFSVLTNFIDFSLIIFSSCCNVQYGMMVWSILAY